MTPAMAPKMKYRVPISLWLVENSHRTGFVIKLRFFRFLPYQGGPLRGRSGAFLLKKRERGGGKEEWKALTLLMGHYDPPFLSPSPGSGSGKSQGKDLTSKQSLEFSLIQTGLARK